MSDNNYRYSVFRCIDPVATNMKQPWFPIEDKCPCDPNLSNTSGRGFTPCPFGVQFNQSQLNKEINKTEPLMTVVGLGKPEPVNTLPFGSMMPNFINIPNATPPQLQPRALIRIGEQWRSGN